MGTPRWVPERGQLPTKTVSQLLRGLWEAPGFICDSGSACLPARFLPHACVDRGAGGAPSRGGGRAAAAPPTPHHALRGRARRCCCCAAGASCRRATSSAQTSTRRASACPTLCVCRLHAASLSAELRGTRPFFAVARRFPTSNIATIQDYIYLHNEHSDWVTRVQWIPEIGLVTSSLDASIKASGVGQGELPFARRCHEIH
jgi:hypothetical protein